MKICFLMVLIVTTSSAFSRTPALPCGLWGGKKKIVKGSFGSSSAICLFPQPKYYCSHYKEQPIIIKSQGRKYCVAEAKCMKEACKWKNGERPSECKDTQAKKYDYTLACRAAPDNRCPPPTICALDTETQVLTNTSVDKRICPTCSF